jgi:type VI secretion system secreted protein VgrG
MSVATPLGADVLLLRGMRGTEQLSAPFELELDLLSENAEIAPDSLLGQGMTVELELLDGSTRYFNGICNRFYHTGYEDRFTGYRATLVPWLWLLTRSSDCKIFQDMTVPDIVKQVFRDAGFTDFEEALSGSYRTWEYCVQYRETHYNFVCRLMEQEGIYFYFKHSSDKHALVLADSYGSHEPFPGHAEIPYHTPAAIAVRERDYVFDWSVATAIRSGAFAHDDYDFTHPRNELLARSMIGRGHAHGEHEIFDYPGEYEQNADGDAYARVRMEELQADYELAHGVGYSRGIAAGSLFSFTDHPRSSQNREYLVLSATHHLTSDAFISTPGPSDAPIYQSSFTAMNAREPFRPPRVTPKPNIQGLQTAVVVGKSGEEIWTDKYGRIKVQFHWDRYGANDEKSSCWIRVAHPWAGKTWGAVALPRIGQEVVVSFLEGDPDRPLVVGSVYNADQMPPYGLPANQTQSGVKSRSSKGGGGDNFNELRFEDKKGEEDVYFHAEKDFHRLVENDDDLKVQNNQTIEIKQDRTETITDGNESVTVKKGNRTVELSMGNDSLTLKQGNRTVKIDMGKSTTEAMQSIELKVGQSSVKLDQKGVTIKGLMIKIEGQTTVDMKGLKTAVNGDAMLTLKGGVTMIN